MNFSSRNTLGYSILVDIKGLFEKILDFYPLKIDVDSPKLRGSISDKNFNKKYFFYIHIQVIILDFLHFIHHSHHYCNSFHHQSSKFIQIIFGFNNP